MTVADQKVKHPPFSVVRLRPVVAAFIDGMSTNFLLRPPAEIRQGEGRNRCHFYRETAAPRIGFKVKTLPPCREQSNDTVSMVGS